MTEISAWYVAGCFLMFGIGWGTGALFLAWNRLADVIT